MPSDQEDVSSNSAGCRVFSLNFSRSVTQWYVLKQVLEEL